MVIDSPDVLPVDAALQTLTEKTEASSFGGMDNYYGFYVEPASRNDFISTRLMAKTARIMDKAAVDGEFGIQIGNGKDRLILLEPPNYKTETLRKIIDKKEVKTTINKITVLCYSPKRGIFTTEFELDRDGVTNEKEIEAWQELKKLIELGNENNRVLENQKLDINEKGELDLSYDDKKIFVKTNIIPVQDWSYAQEYLHASIDGAKDLQLKNARQQISEQK